MYKNVKLWTKSMEELVERVDGGYRAKQTMHYRNGSLKPFPYIERGSTFDAEGLEDLMSAYRRGRLYFKVE